MLTIVNLLDMQSLIRRRKPKHFSGRLALTFSQKPGLSDGCDVHHCVSKKFPPVNSLELCRILSDFQNSTLLKRA